MDYKKLLDDYLSDREDKRKRDDLIVSLSNYVHSLAQKHFSFAHPWYEDIYQYGMIGAIKAVDEFDPEQAGCLTTFAYWKIREQFKLFSLFHRISKSQYHITKADEIDTPEVLEGISSDNIYRNVVCSQLLTSMDERIQHESSVNKEIFIKKLCGVEEAIISGEYKLSSSRINQIAMKLKKLCRKEMEHA